MNRQQRWGMALLLFAVMVGCTRQPPEAPPLPPPQVTVQRPVAREVADTAEFTGRTDAVEMVEIRVRVKGFLQSVKFKEGDDVKKDQLLYEIDPRTFQADLENAKSELARLEAQLQQTSSEANRAGNLRSRNAIGEEEYIQKVAAKNENIAAIRKSQAAVKSSELELSFTQIKSPIDGVISRTQVTIGNLVGYNEPTLLTTIVKMDPIYCYFDATERGMLEYDKLVREQQAGTAVEAKVPVYVGLVTDKGYPHQGIIDFRDNKVDPATGTIRLRGVFENKNRLLTPGLFARVRVPIGSKKPRLLVPESALSADQRGRFLLTVGPDNIVLFRPVQVGTLTDDGMIVVTEGLKPDDRVIVNGLQRARPGSKVDPKDKTEQPAKGS